MNLPRLVRTVAPLRPVQIYGRISFRLRRPRVDMAPAPRLDEISGWKPSILRSPLLTEPFEICVLNQTGPVKTGADWNAADRDKLWLYNLHYFDELSAPADADRSAWHRALIERWISENPPGAGNGWEPYPTSLRIVNWIKWFLNGERPEAHWLDSLAAQTRWLMGRLEWHLLGNHLFANAKALVFAGLFFEGPEADRWLERGRSILRREMDEQILVDGAHFELSPMYHAIILEDVLDLVNLAGANDRIPATIVKHWADAAKRMLDWLGAMVHPDGAISFFNDASFGIAPDLATLETYAHRLGVDPVRQSLAGVTHLEASGYVRMQQADAVAILDLAEIGPRYLPGHAHADTLSFELSLGRERVIVNQGVSAYAGPRRAAERSTAAHSTVGIGGRDSSEVWSSFRVGRRARVTDLDVKGGDTLVAQAEHDGYRHLRGAPRHRRVWRMSEGVLEVADRVTGVQPAVAHFNLHPDVLVELSADARSARLTTNQGGAIDWRSSTPLSVESFDWAYEFGRSVSSRRLVAGLEDGLLETRLEW